MYTRIISSSVVLAAVCALSGGNAAFGWFEDFNGSSTALTINRVAAGGTTTYVDGPYGKYLRISATTSFSQLYSAFSATNSQVFGGTVVSAIVNVAGSDSNIVGVTLRANGNTSAPEGYSLLTDFGSAKSVDIVEAIGNLTSVNYLNSQANVLNSTHTYRFEFSAFGTTLHGRVWDLTTGSSTPVADISATDDSRSSGIAGLSGSAGAILTTSIGTFDNVGATGTIGDTDFDGDVDLSDLGVLATNYGQPGTMGWHQGDFDTDGDVDLNDLGQLATYYGAGAAQAFADFQALTSVPEPSAMLVPSMGLAGLWWRRR